MLFLLFLQLSFAALYTQDCPSVEGHYTTQDGGAYSIELWVETEGSGTSEEVIGMGISTREIDYIIEYVPFAPGLQIGTTIICDFPVPDGVTQPVIKSVNFAPAWASPPGGGNQEQFEAATSIDPLGDGAPLFFYHFNFWDTATILATLLPVLGDGTTPNPEWENCLSGVPDAMFLPDRYYLDTRVTCTPTMGNHHYPDKFNILNTIDLQPLEIWGSFGDQIVFVELAVTVDCWDAIMEYEETTETPEAGISASFDHPAAFQYSGLMPSKYRTFTTVEGEVTYLHVSLEQFREVEAESVRHCSQPSCPEPSCPEPSCPEPEPEPTPAPTPTPVCGASSLVWSIFGMSLLLAIHLL